MSDRKIKRTLISVFDKTGIVDLARALVDEFGIEIISTGGTASLLKKEGVPVTMVEEVTDFPEMMNGRVKTLHPKVHAGILADRDSPDHMRQIKEQDIEPIDMVVVNLYPFGKTVADPDCTFEQAIEMIDIGGPSMLRAAAKNHKHVVVVSDSAQIDPLLAHMREHDGTVDADNRVALASRVFEQTADYDAAIHDYLAGRKADGTKATSTAIGTSRLHLPSRPLHSSLRYGENPHQHAAAYSTEASSQRNGIGTVNQKPLSGTEISFNNFVDADAALALCHELSRSTPDTGVHNCVFIKHTNACGVGTHADPIEAYRRAYAGDPNAAMGGILACDFPIDAAFAETVMNTYGTWGKEFGAGGFFVEVWVAPAFAEDALEVIKTTKAWGQRVRLLAVGDFAVKPDAVETDVKKIAGGMLVQDRDLVGLNEDQWKVVTKRQPTDRELQDLRLAWLVCKHTKSNAITVCNDAMLIGNGAGQMSRVMSCRIATWLAKENGHADRLTGAVAASDAFFPFPDGPNILMDAGITAIIQPGGSKRDADTIGACDARNVAMICTGTRHFKH